MNEQFIIQDCSDGIRSKQLKEKWWLLLYYLFWRHHTDLILWWPLPLSHVNDGSLNTLSDGIFMLGIYVQIIISWEMSTTGQNPPP